MSIERTEIVLPARGGVDLRAAVLCRGHRVLPPWSWQTGTDPCLERAEALPDGTVHLLRIRSHPRGIVLGVAGRHARQIEMLAPLAVRVRRSLGLDADPTAFRRHCRRDPLLRSAVGLRLGPVLRATTAFEDVVRLLAARSVAGATPDRAINGLLRLGRRCPADPRRRAFPSPAALARLPVATLRRRTGLGQEAAWLSTLARRVDSGRLDLRILDDLSCSEAARLLATIRGLDAPARARMLLLLGHHDTVALDRMGRAILRGALGGDAQRLSAWLRAQRPWAGLASWIAVRLHAADSRAVGAQRPVRRTRATPVRRAPRS